MLQTFTELVEVFRVLDSTGEVLQTTESADEDTMVDEDFCRSLHVDDVNPNLRRVVGAGGPGVVVAAHAAEDGIGYHLLVVHGENGGAMTFVVLTTDDADQFPGESPGAEPIGRNAGVVVSSTGGTHADVNLGGAARGKVFAVH
uniref:Uncharacterized protein n=1 Tax=Pseudomonas phage vB_PaeP_FBPa39 TaxID=3231239 RepID=A0AAU8KV34_9VIRU